MQEINVNISKEDIIKHARDIRKHAWCKASSTWEALNRLVCDKGGKIEYCKHFESHDEKLVVADDGSFTIFLPLGSTAARDNFTIAHELGHFFLHFRAPGGATFARQGSNRQEWEANWFAAELLMPEDEFRLEVRKKGNDPKLLSQSFDVSPAAASVRLKTLGLA